MLRLNCSPSTQLYLRSTVDTALRIYRQLSLGLAAVKTDALAFLSSNMVQTIDVMHPTKKQTNIPAPQSANIMVNGIEIKKAGKNIPAPTTIAFRELRNKEEELNFGQMSIAQLCHCIGLLSRTGLSFTYPTTGIARLLRAPSTLLPSYSNSTMIGV